MIEKYINQIIEGDCLNFMKDIPDEFIDCILVDPPYGTTNCHWDSIISLDSLWGQFKRIRKDNSATIIFGMQPFTSVLVCSNINEFKYNWIWEKSHVKNFLNSWKQPLRKHETISVFYKNQCFYNPQIIDKPIKNIRPKTDSGLSDCYGKFKLNIHKLPKNKSLPVDIIYFPNQQDYLHPNQKPLRLIEYLIRTYSDENNLILDSCSGSGTTAIACHRLNRRFICIEKEKKYVDLSRERLKKEIRKTPKKIMEFI